MNAAFYQGDLLPQARPPVTGLATVRRYRHDKYLSVEFEVHHRKGKVLGKDASRFEEMRRAKPRKLRCAAHRCFDGKIEALADLAADGRIKLDLVYLFSANYRMKSDSIHL